MKFSDIKVGQEFKFAFDRDLDWVYVKDNDEFYTEIRRPTYAERLYGSTITYPIKNMTEEEIILV
jgi:hypothetical protein